MITIVKFGYSDSFSVGRNFDLNSLYDLQKVKYVDDKYIIDRDSEINITILPTNIVYGEEANQIELAAAKEAIDQRYRWYQEEMKKSAALKSEVDSLKAALALLTLNNQQVNGNEEEE